MCRAAWPAALVLAGVMAAAQTAQNPTEPVAVPQSTQNSEPGQTAVIDQLASGTEIRATLDTPLSAKTSKPGDRFTATVAVPARGSVGTVVLPNGARLEGEVAEPEESKTVAALRGKGALSLRFRDLVLPNGQTLPLTATLISVNSTNGSETKRTDEEGRNQPNARRADPTRDVAIASPGSPSGVVFGGPLKGLAIGQISGGGYVVSTKGKDVTLPAQTGMVIRLDQPVSSAVTSAPQN